MNCCNDYGQCKQGPNCPARETRITPQPVQLQDDELDLVPDWIAALLWVLLAFTMTAVVGLNLGYWLHA